MRKRWIAIARGDEPADLVLSGGSVLSVFTGEVFRANVAIADGHVVGVGDYQSGPQKDVSGKFLTPGFIDGHCHIESSKLNVDEFARAVLPSGTTTVVIDPHEMANVLGVRGVEYMLEASKGLPLGVYVMIPSCVPASEFESPASPLEAYDFAELLQRQRVVGIAEMMDYPSAIAGQAGVLSKMAMTGYRHVDGHAPGISGRDLNAYIVSGPSSDHECTTIAEALEKRRLGMWVMIREASMIRNLVDLLPLVQEYGTENTMFVTDDREAGTLLDEGHMNAIVRKAVANGLSPGDAVKLASLNVARYHGLQNLGAVAPTYAADILVLPNLTEFRPEMVFKNGELVAENGEARQFESPPAPSDVLSTVHLAETSAADFRIPVSGERTIRVVDIVRDQVLTRAGTAVPTVSAGETVADPAKDLVKLVVVERHHATGRMGKGFVRGFGLREGAMASTVAHDAHNVVVAGVSDGDMACAVGRLAEIGGGLAVSLNGAIVGDLPLEIGGLMSRLDARSVAERIAALEMSLRKMGVELDTPFMYLSFLALSVIPEMRVTDRGLVDVRSFEVVPLGVT
jgi:adenine deaminase